MRAVKSSRIRLSWAAYVYVYMRACVLCFVGSYVPKVVRRDVFDRYPHFTPVARQKQCAGEQEIYATVVSARTCALFVMQKAALVHVHVRA